MRRRLGEIVARLKKGDRYARFYDVFISFTAFLSMVPLMFKTDTHLLRNIDSFTVIVLIIDYFLCFITYDRVCHKKAPFLRYPFSFLAVIDLISILPSLGILPQSLKILRILRITKAFRHSDSFLFIIRTLKKKGRILFSIAFIALCYIFVSAIIMFNFEPDSFNNFFTALYWSATALTTVGYGDIYPVSDVGRLVSMLSSLVGIAIIALPSGIITASFVEEIKRTDQNDSSKPRDSLKSGDNDKL